MTSAHRRRIKTCHASSSYQLRWLWSRMMSSGCTKHHRIPSTFLLGVTLFLVTTSCMTTTTVTLWASVQQTAPPPLPQPNSDASSSFWSFSWMPVSNLSLLEFVRRRRRQRTSLRIRKTTAGTSHIDRHNSDVIGQQHQDTTRHTATTTTTTASRRMDESAVKDAEVKNRGDNTVSIFDDTSIRTNSNDDDLAVDNDADNDDEIHPNSNTNDENMINFTKIINEDPKLRRVIHAEVSLIDLRFDLSELRRDVSEEPYIGVYGTFCALNWSLYKENPNLYPMYNDLIQHSPECHEEASIIRNVDLRMIAKMTRLYDQQQKQQEESLNLQPELTSSTGHPPSVVKVLNVTTMIFHESRCGSTLTTNILTAMDPIRHRVYSEPRPILQAMTSICGEDSSVCSTDTAASILIDTIYIMSRSSTPTKFPDTGETNVFYKFPSIATRNLPVFIKAFPNKPYLLLYRDPVEVMVSHFHPKVPDSSTVTSSLLTTTAKGKKSNEVIDDIKPYTIKCLAKRHSPGVGIVGVVQKFNPRSRKVLAKTLPDCDYCASHLASITEMMVSTVTSNAIVINYRDFLQPDTLYNDIVPKLIGSPNTILSSESKLRIEQVTSVYSKNRGTSVGHITRNENADSVQINNHSPNNNHDHTFVMDHDMKHQLASPEIRNAATKYLLPSYLQLEALAQRQKK
jgi:hypothetical protein